MNPGRINGLLFALAVSALEGIACGSRAPASGPSGALGVSLRSGAVTIDQGGTATVEIDLTRTSYGRPVAVTLAGLDDSGITADALVIDPSSTTGTLSLHAAATAAVGTATGTVQGNGADGSAAIAVTVRARAPGSSLAIAVTPRSVTIPRGGQATIQVDLTRINYSRPVIVAIDGLSAAGIDSGGGSVDAQGSTAVITLFASPTAALGTAAGTVVANEGDARAPITATVVAAGDFSVDFSPPLLTIQPRQTTFAVVTVTRFGGFAGAIDFAISGLPPGVTANRLTIAGTEVLGLLAISSDGSGSPVSAVPVVITGTSGASSASTTFALTLRGINLAVASPGLFIGQGQTAGVAVAVATLASVSGPRTITVAGLPQGVGAAPLEIPDGETFGSLLFTAEANAPTGTATMTVSATSGPSSASATVALTVEQNLVRIASLDPSSVTIAAGSTRRVVVEVVRTGSFRTLAMPVSAAGLPAGVTADPIFLPTQSSTGVLILRAAADATLGAPAPATINAGTSGTDPCSFDCTVLASATLGLAVVEPFDFALAAPSVSLQQGSTSSAAITLRRNAGFVGSVALHVNGLPEGVAAQDVVFAPGTTRAAIDLTATAAAPASNSLLGLTATGAGFSASHEVPLQIFVPDGNSPSIASFVPRTASVFVGERTQLTAVFTGDGASIDGIGPVQSGQAVDTPVLSRSTSFVLRVQRGTQQVEARVTVTATYRNRFRALTASPVGRGVHLAATAPDGSVLLMGGHTSDAANIPSDITTQRFDPTTEATTNGPDLPWFVNTPDTSSVQLPGGGFLLIGGGINSNTMGLGADAGRATMSFELAGRRFVRAGNTQENRRAFTLATPLLDGGALLSGGSSGLSFFDSTERFDSATGHWSNAGSMSAARVVHTATRLADGRVLVAGGLQCCIFTPGLITAFSVGSTEIYDPETDQFTPTGSLASARSFHTATLLPDGRVLVAGGAFAEDPDPPPANAEIYDPSTGEFSPAGDLQVPRGGHAAVLLTDGRVLVLGGTDVAHPNVGIQQTEIFDPATNGWSLGPVLDPAWIGSTVTLLDNGKVLVFGGETPQGDPVSTVLLFE